MEDIRNNSVSKNVWGAKIWFFSIFLTFLFFNALFKPRIIVVHSLSKNDLWVKEFNQGFQAFSSKKNLATISYQYLDAHSYYSEIYKLKQGVLSRQIIDRFNPSLLILCGSNAQDLIGRTYINVPNKTIIFCGLNGSLQDYGYEEARNVTGVFEHIPTEAFKEIIPFLAHKQNSSEPIKLFFLGDNSENSKVLKQVFGTKEWSPNVLIDLTTVNTFEDWKNAILTASLKADILIVSDYKQIYKDENQKSFMPVQELIQWTLENTSMPIIGSLNTFVKDGGPLAIVPSPIGQGETVAHLTNDILHGRSLKELPTSRNKDFLIYLNDLHKKNIAAQLPSIYKAFHRALHNYEK